MIDERKILAVITARANSAGLPGKNYKSLLGKPLIIWSLLAAFRSKYIDTIFISTNCPFVKEICSEWIGANYNEQSWMHTKDGPRVIIIDRPEELCTPLSKNEEALMHSVQMYEEKYEESPDIIVNLQPTSPIRNDWLIDKCIETMHDNNSDSLLTVNRHTPFFWRIEKEEAKAMYDPVHRPMRQQLKEGDYFWHDNGNIYAMTLDTLTNRMCRIGLNPFLYETSPFQSLQIDTDFDFQLIEKMAEVRGAIL